MNKNNWTIIFYILIMIVIGGIFLRLLPYLLICGVVIWGIVKIYGFFNRKSNKYNNTEGSTNNYEYKAEENKEDVSEDNTEDINKAIDVDYKDV